ncbi:CHAD domain-containing protein [uncultured Amnibacterium sp.]|uniref:CYTH and CHAD domain-containing protein n=1 Tax=uncultured Amnibacterium sp. TaxID=1631851 RepID=UPI0035C978F0
MPGRTHLEIERKYAVDAGTAVPTFAGTGITSAGITSVRSVAPVHLEAVYYDTEDRRLLAARIALRRRTGGHDAGWHVKLPGTGGRLEVQGPIDPADPDTPPPAVRAAIRSRVRDRPLTPLARISTERTAVVLGDEDGERVEFVDDLVQATDVRGGVLRSWREWEAEQVGDDPARSAAVLDALEPLLLAAGARPSASPAKLAQALGLGQTDGDAHLNRAASSDTAGEAVRSRLAALVADLEDGETALRTADDQAGRDDAVHAMRTTIRRLRSVLGLQTVLGPEAKRPRDELRVLALSLGDSRDRAVLAETAAALLAEVPDEPGLDAAVSRLVTGVQQDAAERAATALTRLDGRAHVVLMDTLEAISAATPTGPDATSPAHRVLPPLIARHGRRAYRRLRSAGSSEPALHAGRRAARRFHYLVDDLGGSAHAGRRLRAARKRAKRVQSTLGSHRDLMLLAEELPFIAAQATAAGENAFIYGVLAERARSRAAELLTEAGGAARRLAVALQRLT